MKFKSAGNITFEMKKNKDEDENVKVYSG